MKTRVWVLVVVLIAALASVLWAAAAEPARMLPVPPGPILDLRANAAGDLYVRTATKVLWMDFKNPEEGWNALALDGVVDLTENAGREVFARQDLRTRFAIHRLAGAKATLVTTTPNVPCEFLYVDALGRAWLQNRERLLVVGKDKTLLEWPMGQPGYGIRFRLPCEWKPGHVVLFFASIAVWATPEKVAAEAAPLFADDGTGNGPFLMGTDRLVSGGCNNKGAGSFLLDPREPGKEPERMSLGKGDWFYGVATAPDGRLLVRPHRGFVWYGADGHSEVKLKEAGPILDGASLREPGKSRVVFAGTGVGFAALPGGMLAIFRADEAVMLTPATGLPLPRVEHLAAIGNDLIMSGGGKIAVWRTTETLPKPVGTDLQEGLSAESGGRAAGGTREWPLTGPCVRDVNGTMCAFLLDFPGKLSRHDGTRWEHIAIELGNRNPYIMTGDDKGRLQIGFMDAPSGSYLVSGSAVTNWADYTRAWIERFDGGPAFFRDGSSFRPRHLVAGKDDWIWMYDGRTLRTGQQEYDYYDSPPYRCFWLGAGGACYRGGGGRVWIFANGRWTETEAPPLSIGPDGIRTGGTGKDRLPAVYDGQIKLPLPGASAGSKPRFLTLQGNEAFIPAADGGGWVGQNRIFRNAYYPLAGRIYPGTNGHYLVIDKTLRFQPLQKLTVTGEVTCTGAVKRLVCKIGGSEPLYQPRLLAFLDGEFLDRVTAPEGADLPPVGPGGHTLDVYAADGFGVVSEQPLRVTLDGGREFEVVDLELGEEWDLKPRRLQILPPKIAGRSVLGRTLEIDAEGVAWILVEDGVISIDLTRRQAAFHRFPAQELVAARGRVWALGNYDKTRLQMPIYELRREGPRHAVDLYDDLPRCIYGPQLIADSDGGIWTLGQRTAVRWDGQRTQSWERNTGFGAQVIPHPDGAVILSYEQGFVYRNGDLSSAIRWSKGGERSTWPVYPLGRNHLIMPSNRVTVDLASGQPVDLKLPRYDVAHADRAGNLYAWKGRLLSRFSGSDLSETKLAPCTPPRKHPSNDPGGYQFLATTNAFLVYSVDADQLVAGAADKGAVEYGWQEGILPAYTHAIREAPDGRIWFLRSNQLLVIDPAQPTNAVTLIWPGWRCVPIAPRVTAGGFGRIWYGLPDRKTVGCMDGTNETSWAVNGRWGDLIVTDQGTAAFLSGDITYIFAPGKPTEQAKDRESAILELIRRGAREFAGANAPVIAADGRVYFRGQLWDGQTWHRVPEGRASRDLRGELHLLCRSGNTPPGAYRFEGVKAVTLGPAEQCMIDAEGLRWYDPGLEESSPGTMPVWHGGKDASGISSSFGAKRSAPGDYSQAQATPVSEGRFLVQVDGKLHVLDSRGLKALPGDRVPCGSGDVYGICRLADGRWAFASTNGRLFISPPNLNFSP